MNETDKKEQNMSIWRPSQHIRVKALGLFSFPSLAEYEAYREKSFKDAECQKAVAFAERTKCIRRYDRHFLRPLNE